MKRSLRDYLLTLVLAIVVFTVAAVFLLSAAEGLMKDMVTKIGSEAKPTAQEVFAETSEKEDPPVDGGEEVQKDETVTFLLLGLDYQKQTADAIFLVGVNATKKQATVALIPSDTVVPEGSSKYELGSLFSSRSVSFYKEFVQQETGIMADFYATVPMSALANLVDILGGISYDVPENISVSDPEQNLKINLSAGKQTLNGDRVIQLLRYQGYAGGKSAREDVQLGLVRSLCTVFLTPSNYARASSIHNNFYYNCATDFEEADLKQWGEILFNLTTYSPNYTRIPGATSGSFYAISTPRAKAMFEIYQ